MTSRKTLLCHAITFLSLLVHSLVPATHAKAQTLNTQTLLTGDLGASITPFSLQDAVHAWQREQNSLHYALSPINEPISSGLHPGWAAAALNAAPTPLLGLAAAAFIPRTTDATPLALATPIVLGGTSGVATGYGISKLFGTEYGWNSAMIDFGLGAISGPAITALARTTKSLASVRKLQKVPDDVTYAHLGSDGGETTWAGKIFLDTDLKGTSEALSVYRHEYVHRILTPLKGPFVAARQRILELGYNKSHFLKWFEESLAEGIRRGGIVKGFKYPVQPSNYHPYGTLYGISQSKAAIEALGVAGGYYSSIHTGLYVGDLLPVD